MITKPADQTVNEFSEAVFNCTASGNPEPRIKWVKDGETVGTEGTLIFKAVRNDSGKYWCSVENGVGLSINVSAHLEVKCKY